MALTFPAPVTYIADLLRVPSRSFRLDPQQEYSGLGGGEVLAAELAPTRWTADIKTVPMDRASARVLQSRLEALDGSIRSFYLYDPWKCVPAADPGGVILGASTPAIRTIGSDNKSFSLKGLPVGYVISEGDHIAFDYGSNPTRRALHRVMETQVATAGGNTVLFEVRPHLRPGIAIDLPVTLIKPAAKMVLVPGSLSVQGESGRTVISFQAMQRP
jgi:hypothetical protein